VQALAVGSLYHRVDEVLDAHGLGVPPAILSRSCSGSKSNCGIVDLETLLSTPPEKLPARAIALTFDDSYGEDCLRVAAPLLQRYEAPAVFF
jgi:peptidoglycan/xylan/chitin deacetylase (PgdA/CDA1 family)